MSRVSDPDLYYYSPWVERPRITWPNNARVAFWVAPNVEFYELLPPQGPGRSAYPRPAPDIGMYTIRDYGNRVGFWRMAEMLDDYKIRASISLNVAVFDHLPEIARACTERDWELFSHGIYNTRYLYGMSEAQELSVIEDVKATIFRHSGQKLDGWLSPALSNTPQTMELLVRAGVKYTLDLLIDDQPQPLKLKSGRLVSLPYSLETNDWTGLNILGLPPREYTRLICAQFDRLYREGEKSGTVMALPIHPWMIGFPHRVEPLREALDYICGHAGVWMATGREIADWYLDHHYDAALAQQKRLAGE